MSAFTEREALLDAGGHDLAGGEELRDVRWVG